MRVGRRRLSTHGCAKVHVDSTRADIGVGRCGNSSRLDPWLLLRDTSYQEVGSCGVRVLDNKFSSDTAPSLRGAEVMKVREEPGALVESLHDHAMGLRPYRHHLRSTAAW